MPRGWDGAPQLGLRARMLGIGLILYGRRFARDLAEQPSASRGPSAEPLAASGRWPIADHAEGPLDDREQWLARRSRSTLLNASSVVADPGIMLPLRSPPVFDPALAWSSAGTLRKGVFSTAVSGRATKGLR